MGLILMPMSQISAKESAMRLDADLSSKVTVEGGKIIYEVILITENPEVGKILLLNEPEIQGLPAERIRSDRYFDEIDEKGVKHYSIVIDRLLLNPDKKGNFKIKGGKYRIGINKKIVHDDPFWGPMYYSQPEFTDLDAPDATLTVRSLPEKNKPSDFSGSVGDFKIEVEIPSGDIYENEEALAVVRIFGSGFIPEDSYPDLKKAFSGDTELHSFTGDIKNYIDKGKPFTELNIECYFKPKKSGDISIGEITFNYYDPVSDKYRTIKTSDHYLNVKSRTSKMQSGSNYDI